MIVRFQHLKRATSEWVDGWKNCNSIKFRTSSFYSNQRHAGVFKTAKPWNALPYYYKGLPRLETVWVAISSLKLSWLRKWIQFVAFNLVEQQHGDELHGNCQSWRIHRSVITIPMKISCRDKCKLGRITLHEIWSASKSSLELSLSAYAYFMFWRKSL